VIVCWNRKHNYILFSQSVMVILEILRLVCLFVTEIGVELIKQT